MEQDSSGSDGASLASITSPLSVSAEEQHSPRVTTDTAACASSCGERGPAPDADFDGVPMTKAPKELRYLQRHSGSRIFV